MFKKDKALPEGWISNTDPITGITTTFYGKELPYEKESREASKDLYKKYVEENKKTPDQIPIPEYFIRTFDEDGGWWDVVDHKTYPSSAYIEWYREQNGPGMVYTSFHYDKDGIRQSAGVVLDLSQWK